MAPARERVTDCAALPQGWTRKEVLRQAGASAAKIEVRYVSPTGREITSKNQLEKHLGNSWDLNYFDFESGRILGGSKCLKNLAGIANSNGLSHSASNAYVGNTIMGSSNIRPQRRPQQFQRTVPHCAAQNIGVPAGFTQQSRSSESQTSTTAAEIQLCQQRKYQQQQQQRLLLQQLQQRPKTAAAVESNGSSNTTQLQLRPQQFRQQQLHKLKQQQQLRQTQQRYQQANSGNDRMLPNEQQRSNNIQRDQYAQRPNSKSCSGNVVSSQNRGRPVNGGNIRGRFPFPRGALTGSGVRQNPVTRFQENNRNVPTHLYSPIRVNTGIIRGSATSTGASGGPKRGRAPLSSTQIPVTSVPSSSNHQRSTHVPFRGGIDKTLVPPVRQTASIFKQPVTLVHTSSRDNRSDRPIDLKNISINRRKLAVRKPSQIFWAKRLDRLRPMFPDCDCEDAEMDPIGLPAKICPVGPGIEPWMALASLAGAIQPSSTSMPATDGGLGGGPNVDHPQQPVTGQTAFRPSLDLNPGVHLNPEQPLIHAAVITNQDIMAQERRVEDARARLEQAMRHFG